MLGKKLTSGLIDNRLGKKLTIPVNSLGTKLVKGVTTRHVHNHSQEPKEIKSYLEKR
jgi:hypothetical protein